MRKTAILSAITVLLGLLSIWISDTRPTESETVAEVEAALQELERRTEDVLSQLREDSVGLEGFESLWDEEGIGIIIYDGGKASAWSTRMVPFPVTFGMRDRPQDGVVRLRNGHYVCRTAEQSGQMLVAYALLRTDYGFENRHVSSGWNPRTGVAREHRITLSETGTYPIRSVSGEQVFRLRVSYPERSGRPVALLMWGATLVMLLLTLWHTGTLAEKVWGPPAGFPVTVLGLLAMRCLMMWFEAPQTIYQTELFGPGQYAASWLLPSLGDLLLNTLCVLLLAMRLRMVSITLNPRLRWGLLAFAHLAVIPVHWVLHSLVNDSAFPLNLNMPFSLTWYSMVGLTVSFLVICTYYLVVRWLLAPLSDDRSSWPVRAAVLAGNWACAMVLSLLHRELFPVLVAGGSVVTLMALQQLIRPGAALTALFTPTVAVFSLFATVVLQTELNRHELEDRAQLARKLDTQEDPISEYLFSELEETLLSDRELRNALSLLPGSTDAANGQLQRRLQYEHWNRYRSIYRIYTEHGERLLVSEGPSDTSGLAYMEAEYGKARPTIAEHLRFMGNGNGHRGYLGRLVFEGRRERPALVLFIEFRPAGMEELPGFTDLFIDEGVSLTRALEGYSYARYSECELTFQSGDFRYGLRCGDLDTVRTLHRELSDGYDHLIYRSEPSSLIMVSRPVQGVFGHFTIFSYLFLFYFGCAALLAVGQGKRLRPVLWPETFRQRINLAMAGMMLSSLVIIGVLTVQYVITSHGERNSSLITEKSKSVQVELVQKLGDRNSLDITDRGVLFPILSKLSKVFFTDINLYGLDGRLLSSSRPRVFKEGFMAQMMDPKAYTAMRFGHHSSLIQTERIGKLEYQTAYLPFRNMKGDIIAFLSIPYFGRQYGLQQEILSLLAPLVDIYVFLILLGVLVALLISNRITEPLRIIRQSLRELRLEGGNRTIQWESNDEIGDLVKEYNRTLDELVRSAERLARSEREGAWREMAKQVAHEIKNPLTPMKLSIQMLERSHRDGAPDLGERIERTARTLVEQIDALSHIASEFSGFAQMPRAEATDFDLRELLLNVAELHQGQGALIVTELPDAGPCTVHADREQMLRVFNNLVRNALQAMTEDRPGKIVLGVNDLHHGQWTATVKDNGRGIPEELRDKVFIPNFTTKSGGMGLGLAMCRRMVESAEGSIWFETETDRGTTFFVSLPALEA